MNRIEQINELAKDLEKIRNIVRKDEQLKEFTFGTLDYENHRMGLAVLYKGIQKKYPQIKNYETLMLEHNRLHNIVYGKNRVEFRLTDKEWEQLKSILSHFDKDNLTNGLRGLMTYIKMNNLTLCFNKHVEEL